MITINQSKTRAFVKASDMQDGKAYCDSSGYIYIGNRYEDIVAFAVDGDIVLLNNDDNSPDNQYYEVDLEIFVS